MAKTIEVTLPSGAVVVVKRLGSKVLGEIRDLMRRAEKNDSVNRLVPFFAFVDRQVVEVLDFGPYVPFKGTGDPQVPYRISGEWIHPDSILDGDFDALSAALYVAKYGDEPFKLQTLCPCSKVQVVSVDVQRRLSDEVRPYSAQFLEAYKVALDAAKERSVRYKGQKHKATSFESMQFEAVYEDDDHVKHAFTWSPNVGRIGAIGQEQWVDRVASPSTARSVAFKIVKLDELTSREQIASELEDWDEDDLMGLLDMMAEHEGGIENVLEIICSVCATKFEAILPFTQLLIQVVAAPMKSRSGSRRGRRTRASRDT